MKSAKVLFIGGEKSGLEAIKLAFKKDVLPHLAFSARTQAEAKKLVAAGEFDVVVIGYAPGDKAAVASLAQVKDGPLLVVCENDALSGAVKEIKTSPFLFIIKDKSGAYVKQTLRVIDHIVSCGNDREENRILEQVVADINDIVYVVNTDDTIRFVNKAFLKAFGYSEEEALKMHASDLWVEELQNSEVKKLMDALPRREAYGRRKDGTEFPASLSRSPIKGCDDRDAYIAVVAHDISEHKRSIDQFKNAVEEFNRLSNAMEQTASSVMITNKDGVIEYVNAGFEKLTGFTRAEILGKTPRVMKSGKHDQGFYQALWKKLLSGEAFRGVFINS
ncbi:MAG: PAS domain-containing protein [Endomicrobiales bacterium]